MGKKLIPQGQRSMQQILPGTVPKSRKAKIRWGDQDKHQATELSKVGHKFSQETSLINKSLYHGLQLLN